MEWLRDVNTLAFSGGGIRGIAHIGALEAFETYWQTNYQRSIYTHIENISGSSIGSVVGFFLANKTPLEELKDLFLSDVWNALYQQIDLPKVTSNFGLIDAHKTQRKMLERVLSDPNETFCQLKARTGISFTVCVSCLDTNSYEYHSDVTTPLYSVVTSVLASCAIPLIFQPLIIHGRRYVDGALLNNIPLPCYFNLETSLALNLKSNVLVKKGTPFPNTGNYYQMILSPLLSYIEELMYLTLNFIEKEQQNNLPKSFQSHIVYLQCPAKVASWNFTLSGEARLALFQNGQESMKKFLSTHVMLVGELMTSFIVNYVKDVSTAKEKMPLGSENTSQAMSNSEEKT